MRYLIDAHTLLWSQDDISGLSAVATSTLIDPAHDRGKYRDHLGNRNQSSDWEAVSLEAVP